MMHVLLISFDDGLPVRDATATADILTTIAQHPLLAGTISDLTPTTVGALCTTTASTATVLEFMRWCTTNLTGFMGLVSVPIALPVPTVRLLADTSGDLVAAAQWFKQQPEVMSVQFSTLDWRQSRVPDKDHHTFNLAVDLSVPHDQITMFLIRMLAETDIRVCTVYRMSEKEVTA